MCTRTGVWSICMYTTCIQEPREVIGGVRSRGTGIADTWKLSCVLGTKRKCRKCSSLLSISPTPSETLYCCQVFHGPHILYHVIWAQDPQLKPLGSVWLEAVTGLVCGVIVSELICASVWCPEDDVSWSCPSPLAPTIFCLLSCIDA